MALKGALSEKTVIRVKEPAKYQVVMLNDDFTTMDFVVSVLVEIFRKDPASAEQIMLHVHKNGKAVVGIYPYDIAVTKTDEAMKRAKNEGFPFRMLVVEV
ncbi:MAG: ATP-dependent Clp protease adaptor ClpS [Lachnospiraceae bacterium]|nr:ATP-dependent Clp protease adaptor ClpS [Lachnospiraceae bacterium]MBP5223547.1 ATP-dependent Clp protease adaptor ClpS [Lachnospiraceae bacterium]